MNASWETIWRELREALKKRKTVNTLAQAVINDIVRVDVDAVVVRSHRTKREDRIEADRFKTWWDHLCRKGSASLVPGDANNPHRWRSCVVGAIWAHCLPSRIDWDRGRPSEIWLKS